MGWTAGKRRPPGPCDLFPAVQRGRQTTASPGGWGVNRTLVAVSRGLIDPRGWLGPPGWGTGPSFRGGPFWHKCASAPSGISPR